MHRIRSCVALGAMATAALLVGNLEAQESSATTVGRDLPTVEALLELRGIALDPAWSGAVRMSGRIRFPDAGVAGTFVRTTVGKVRLRTDFDLGQFGRRSVVVDGESGWRISTLVDETPLTPLPTQMSDQIRLTDHPTALWSDWREDFDSVSVTASAQTAGRPVYVVRLERTGLGTVRAAVDAQTGDVLQLLGRLALPDVGVVPVQTVFEDFRDIRGLRVPFRTISTTDAGGRTVTQVERIEFDIDVDDSLFEPAPPSGRL